MLRLLRECVEREPASRCPSVRLRQSLAQDACHAHVLLTRRVSEADVKDAILDGHDVRDEGLVQQQLAHQVRG